MKLKQIFAVVALLSLGSVYSIAAEKDANEVNHDDSTETEEVSSDRAVKKSEKKNAKPEGRCTTSRDFAKGKETK